MPLVLAGAGWLGRHRRSWSRRSIGLAAIALALVPVLIRHTPDGAYYGTHVRGAEFLAGCWLALWMRHRDQDGWEPWQRRVLACSGLASLVALVAVMLLVDRNQAWIYQGGMGLFAVPAMLVIAGCVTGAAWLGTILGFAPLRWLGVAALSIYVLHWPLFQVAGHLGKHLSTPVLIAAELSIAIAVGSLAHVFIERPLMVRGANGRSPSRISDGRVLIPALAAMALVAAVALVWPVPPPAYDFEAAQRRSTAARAPEATVPTPAPSSAPVAAEPLAPSERLGVFGGSSALMLGLGLWGWTAAHPQFVDVPGWTELGCGVITNGVRFTPDGSRSASRDDPQYQARPPTNCDDWASQWERAASEHDIDVALVAFGAWDTSDWQLDGDDQWRTVGDDLIDATIVDDLGAGVDALLATGTGRVILATAPVTGPGATGDAPLDRAVPDDHAERIGRFNQLLFTVAAHRSDVDVVDFGALVDSLDPADAGRLMPDGVHATESTAGGIWGRLLGPVIVDSSIERGSR